MGTVLSPQLVTDAATITGTIDTRGFAYLTIEWNADTEEGSGASATVLSILESDDTVITNFATITANVAPDYVNPHLRTYAIDLRGRKRYLRISFTAATETGDITISGTYRLYRGATAPNSTTEMTDGSNDVATIL